MCHYLPPHLLCVSDVLVPGQSPGQGSAAHQSPLSASCLLSLNWRVFCHPGELCASVYSRSQNRIFCPNTLNISLEVQCVKLWHVVVMILYCSTHSFPLPVLPVNYSNLCTQIRIYPRPPFTLLVYLSDCSHLLYKNISIIQI